MDENERHKKGTSSLQDAFLSALALTGNITKAAEATNNMSRTNHYKWLEDEEYKKRYELAMEEAAERLEIEARRRAVEGTDEPVFYQGARCGTVKKYSDNLLMFLMKGANPNKYADRIKQESVNTNTNINQDVTHMTREDREKRIAELLAKRDKKE